MRLERTDSTHNPNGLMCLISRSITIVHLFTPHLYSFWSNNSPPTPT